MAVSAFRSNSRRVGAYSSTLSSRESTETSTSPNKKPLVPPRRSRSVSAHPRRGDDVSASSSTPNSSSDFLIKRDNPLFCSGGSPAVADSMKLGGGGDQGRVDPGKAKAGVDDRRGRTTLRNADRGSRMSGTEQKGVGRSLSRARTRSVSQRPVSRGHFVSSEV